MFILLYSLPSWNRILPNSSRPKTEDILKLEDVKKQVPWRGLPKSSRKGRRQIGGVPLWYTNLNMVKHCWSHKVPFFITFDCDITSIQQHLRSFIDPRLDKVTHTLLGLWWDQRAKVTVRFMSLTFEEETWSHKRFSIYIPGRCRTSISVQMILQKSSNALINLCVHNTFSNTKDISCFR